MECGGGAIFGGDKIRYEWNEIFQNSKTWLGIRNIDVLAI